MKQLTSSRASAAAASRQRALQRHGVWFVKPQVVRRHLARYPVLARLLPHICAALRDEFGASAELALELYRDSEVNDHYLTLYVRQPKYEPNILERIDRVVERYSKKLGNARAYLLLTTDFRPLRGNNGV